MTFPGIAPSISLTVITTPRRRAHRMREFPPMDHYDYGELDSGCICMICIEWRAALSQLQTLQSRIPHHGQACKCTICVTAMRARSAYLAALNRRDLYCESSWHASSMLPQLGESYMQWLCRQISDRKTRGDGWWEGRAPYLPIAHWLVRWKNHLLGLPDGEGLDEALEDFPVSGNGTLATMAAVSVSGMVAV